MSESTPVLNKSDRNILLAVILLVSFFGAFMGASVNIALPDISREFSMSAVRMGWVAMAFLLSSAIFLVPFGKIADMYGRKKIFLAGNIIYAISSFLCVLSTSGVMLIGFRLLQGIGSAMIFSTGMAIITSVYPPHERGKAIGLNTSAVYLGLSLAPVIGGLLTQTFGWRSLFYVNIMAVIIILPFMIFRVKTEWSDAKNDRFDLKGSFIYGITIFFLMYGFSRMPELLAIIFTGLGIMGLVLFILVEKKSEFPVLNMKLFANNRVFAFSNLAALINYAATFAVTFLLSLYLQYVRGLQPQGAGLILVTQPSVMAIVASFAGRLSDKYESRILSSLGMAIIVCGLIMLYFTDNLSTNSWLVSSLVVVGIGFGLFSSPNSNAVMSSVEKKYLGIASAALGTMRITGQMTSMAIATMVIHIFIGSARISPSNLPGFVSSVKVNFLIFAILCGIGVFASMARGNGGNPANRG